MPTFNSTDVINDLRVGNNLYIGGRKQQPNPRQHPAALLNLGNMPEVHYWWDPWNLDNMTLIPTANLTGNKCYLACADNSSFDLSNTTGSNTSQFTVEFWRNSNTFFNLSSNLDQCYIGQMEYGVSNGWCILNGGSNNQGFSIRVWIAVDAAGTPAEYRWDPGELDWSHCVMEYDGTQSAANRIRLIVDGVVISTNITITGTLPASVRHSSAPMKIGRMSDSFNHLAKACIWKCRLWKGKLYGNAASVLFNGGLGLSIPALTALGLHNGAIGLWECNERSGTRRDSSNAGNHMLEVDGPVGCVDLIARMVDSSVHGRVHTPVGYGQVTPYTNVGMCGAFAYNPCGPNGTPTMTQRPYSQLRVAETNGLSTYSNQQYIEVITLIGSGGMPMVGASAVSEIFFFGSADEANASELQYMMTGVTLVGSVYRPCFRFKDTSNATIGDGHAYAMSLIATIDVPAVHYWHATGVKSLTTDSWRCRLNGTAANTIDYGQTTMYGRALEAIQARDNFFFGGLVRNAADGASRMYTEHGEFVVLAPSVDKDLDRLVERYAAHWAKINF